MDQFGRERIEHLERKIARLEQKLEYVLKHLKLDYPDEAVSAVKDLLRQGKKAEAVKFYHREKSVSLTEANAAIEKLAREL